MALPIIANHVSTKLTNSNSLSLHQTWRQHSSGHWQYVGGVSFEIRSNPTAVHTMAEAVFKATGTLEDGLTAPNLVLAAYFYLADNMAAKVFEFRQKKILVQIFF